MRFQIKLMGQKLENASKRNVQLIEASKRAMTVDHPLRVKNPCKTQEEIQHVRNKK
jgi:hypothetical protein